jgi:hypothetical protein
MGMGMTTTTTWEKAVEFFCVIHRCHSITNPLWTDLGLSPVLRSERTVGGCLSRGKTLGRKQSWFNRGAPTIPEGPRKTTKTLSTVCAPSEVRIRSNCNVTN